MGGSGEPSVDLALRLGALAQVVASGDVPSADHLAGLDDVRAELEGLAVEPSGTDPYSRRILLATADAEVMVARWRPGQRCAPHDHGGSSGSVIVLSGRFEEQRFRWQGRSLLADGSPARRVAGEIYSFGPEVVHAMGADAVVFDAGKRAAAWLASVAAGRIRPPGLVDSTPDVSEFGLAIASRTSRRWDP